jgi:hypothetical protein
MKTNKLNHHDDFYCKPPLPNLIEIISVVSETTTRVGTQKGQISKG